MKPTLDQPALREYLRECVPEIRGPIAVEPLSGGQSNPTFLLSDGRTRYVLRRKPPGKLLPSAHAVDREFRVLKALHGTDVPVAKPYALCEDESVIGTAFYVMDCVHGRIFTDPAIPTVTPRERCERNLTHSKNSPGSLSSKPLFKMRLSSNQVWFCVSHTSVVRLPRTARAFSRAARRHEMMDDGLLSSFTMNSITRWGVMSP